jgi:hypothetical protein
VRYRRALFPGFSDQAAYEFIAPEAVATAAGLNGGAARERAAGGATRLHVSARLNYRKIDQSLINFLFGEDSGLTAPVTVLSEDERTIIVVPNGRP